MTRCDRPRSRPRWCSSVDQAACKCVRHRPARPRRSSARCAEIAAVLRPALRRPISASRSGCCRRTATLMRWALVALTAAIAAGVAVWMLRETNRARPDRARPRPRRRARQYPRSGAVRLCRRFRRSALRRLAAVFGLQCRRCGDYHRRARSCWSARCSCATRRRQGAESLWRMSMRKFVIVVAGLARSPLAARALRQERL